MGTAPSPHCWILNGKGSVSGSYHQSLPSTVSSQPQAAGTSNRRRRLKSVGMQDGSRIKAIPTVPSSVGMKSAEKLSYQGGPGFGGIVSITGGFALTTSAGKTLARNTNRPIKTRTLKKAD